MRYFELTPSYGRDYKTAKEAKEAFAENLDWEGDFNLHFAKVNKQDLDALAPYTAVLRYSKNRKLVTVKG